MKRSFAGLCALALLSLVSLVPPTQAQTAVATKTARSFSYDASKEVTLSGTVSSVLAKPSAGMIMGSHLLLTTASGPVDASLGRFGLQGAATSVAAGQQIQVTGIMRTIGETEVFVVRVLKAQGQVYTLRNKHGFPVSPQAGERASRKTAGEGL